MRTPEELHLVDWTALERGCGDGDPPELIRALYAADRDVVDAALDALFDSVLHRDAVYPAAVAAVPYVAHAAAHATHRRHVMLMFLSMAGGVQEQVWTEWEAEGGARVAEELPGLLHLLRDAEPEVRRQAVRAARRAAGESLPPAVAALAARLREDPSGRVRAEALMVLNRLEADPAGRLRAALADRSPAVRATAALCLLERARAPYPAALVDVLVVDAGDPEFRADWDGWFPGVGITEDRLERLLDADPAAGLAVAAGWIAAGDHESRGVRRALRVADTCRGRDAEIAALLLAALARRGGAGRMVDVLGGLADCVGRGVDPAPVVEAALPLLGSSDEATSRCAQGILAEAGDTRLLDLVPDPDPSALAVLAARTGDPALCRRVLRPEPVGTCCDSWHGSPRDVLLNALTPARAAPLLPDLVRLLRTSPSPQLAHALAGLDLADPEPVSELVALTGHANPVLARAAAVAAARLGADPEPALRLLAEGLAEGLAGSERHLADTALLGPVGAPLLPLVERYLTADHHARVRVDAAEALWRITGDGERAAPLLLAELGPSRHGVKALTLLRRTGRPLPPGGAAGR
ncbi:HEAT repeat domain-containing protein [Kitasatospora setae]|uniref:HEAT repeat domain-containing protein n=1 Tax=Kitasatospora setae TaxID=2066 RepID=UPI000526C6C9|nr:HEAT repeat domain-containing protein [Kitasatospora setae]